MATETTIRHVFVDTIPEQLQEATLYISVTHATAVHRCMSCCGHEVVTPLTPTDWKLIFDGRSVSLHPSVGNWSYPCQAHYWIRNDSVQWAPPWTAEQIQHGREADLYAKTTEFGDELTPAVSASSRTGWMAMAMRWLRRRLRLHGREEDR